MPYINFPISPVGPILEVGISTPRSLITPESPPPSIHWFRALADTGCSHTAIHVDVATKAGLSPISKATISSTTHSVAVDVYLGDLFIRAYLMGQPFEFPFRDRRFTQLLNGNPSFDALLGMDILALGTFGINGGAGLATFSW